MIARVWHGWTKKADADGYQELLEREVLPGIASAADGYLGVQVLRRDEEHRVEFMTVTIWDSLAAVRSLVGEDVEVAYVPSEARNLLDEFDERSVHYELVLEAAAR